MHVVYDHDGDAEAAIEAWRREELAVLHERLQRVVRVRLRDFTARSDALAGRLRLLGPEHVLARGYSITFDGVTGEVLRQKGQTHSGQVLRTRLHKGEVRSRVEE